MSEFAAYCASLGERERGMVDAAIARAVEEERERGQMFRNLYETVDRWAIGTLTDEQLKGALATVNAALRAPGEKA